MFSLERTPIFIDRKRLRSAFAPAAALALTISALAAAPGVVLLFDSAYAQILREQLISGGITAPSALATWYVINTAITVLCFLCAAITAGCLWTAILGKPAQAMNLLSTAAQWLLYGVCGSAVLTLLVFVCRLIAYIIAVLPMNEAAYLLYSLLVSEGLMAVQAVLLFMLVRKFLNSAVDTAASIGYTLSSGKLDTMSIPPLTGMGLIILGCVDLVLASDRLFTITIVQAYSGDYYSLLVGAHPGQLLAALALLSGAAGDFLLALWLRGYNRECERARFEHSRKLMK